MLPLFSISDCAATSLCRFSLLNRVLCHGQQDSCNCGFATVCATWLSGEGRPCQFFSTSNVRRSCSGRVNKQQEKVEVERLRHKQRLPAVESNFRGASAATGPSSSTAAKPLELQMGGTSQLQAKQYLPLGATVTTIHMSSCGKVCKLSPCNSLSTDVKHHTVQM